MGVPCSIFSLDIDQSTERGRYSAHDCWQVLCVGVIGAENLHVSFCKSEVRFAASGVC